MHLLQKAGDFAETFLMSFQRSHTTLAMRILTVCGVFSPSNFPAKGRDLIICPQQMLHIINMDPARVDVR